MKFIRGNFDYEDTLYRNKNNIKFNQELEHLLFYCMDQSDSLVTNRVYEKDYLIYIKSITGFVPACGHSGEDIQNWWGGLSDLKLEKKLNSKLTSNKVAKELGLERSSSIIIKNIDELSIFLDKEKKAFLRHPFERSGRNSLILRDLLDFENKRENIKMILDESSLLADKFIEERHWDLGTTFLERGEKFEIEFQIKNLNDENGVFRGAVLLDSIIESEALMKIANKYHGLGAKKHLQVDSFASAEGINWLCEVNYRKTMGHILFKLKRLCPDGSSLALFTTPKKWIKKLDSQNGLDKLIEELDGVFLLSPYNNHLLCWLVVARDRSELHIMAKLWWKKVSVNGVDFPKVFDGIIPDRRTLITGRPI